MTQKYDPYENSIAERVNGILKQEFDIANNKISKHEAQKIVKNSIKIYNSMRPHFSCNLMPLQIAHVKVKFDCKKNGVTLALLKSGINQFL